jgi:hypothetical protein
MAARKKNWTPDVVRQRIRTGVLVNRLKKHVLGEVEMTATQVRAAEILLRKALPDLSATEHSGTVSHRRVEDLSDAELAAIIAGSGTRDAEAPTGETEPSGLH